jgi:hypothetical protein
MGEVLVKAMANSKAGSMAGTAMPLGQPNASDSKRCHPPFSPEAGFAGIAIQNNSKGATHLSRSVPPTFVGTGWVPA